MSLVGVQYLTLIMNRQLLLVRLRSHCEAWNSTDIKPSHSRIQEHTFVNDAVYVDFDGEKVSPVPRRFVIQEYEAEPPINTLHAYPARFDPSAGDTERELLRRDKRFVKLAEVTHERHSGLSAREPSVDDQQDEMSRRHAWSQKSGTPNFRSTEFLISREFRYHYHRT